MLGMLRFAAAYEIPVQDISRSVGEHVRVVGTIADAPRIRTDVDGTRHIRYTVHARELIQGHEERTARGKFYVYTKYKDMEDNSVGKIGDMLTAEGKIRRPQSYQNPGQLDTRFLLRADGITAALFAKKDDIHIEKNTEISLQLSLPCSSAATRGYAQSFLRRLRLQELYIFSRFPALTSVSWQRSLHGLPSFCTCRVGCRPRRSFLRLLSMSFSRGS